MKVTVVSGSTLIESEGETQKDVFEGLASMQEVFTDETCGCCNSTAIRYRCRHSQDPKKKKTFDYFERFCTNCYAKLEYGQHLTGGTLFPKRKDENGNWLPNRGWSKYVKAGEGQAPEPSEPPAQTACDALAERIIAALSTRDLDAIAAELRNTPIPDGDRARLRELWSTRMQALRGNR